MMKQAEPHLEEHGGLRARHSDACVNRLPSLELTDPDGLLTDAARDWLAVHARLAMNARATAGGQVVVRLVNDAEMAAAHLKYSNIPGTTDVLTFDLAEGAAASGAPLDVDILACVDEARRQAAARGHAIERELLLYILHGVLHCLGHDDHDPGAFERMHAEEDRILERIGVGSVFARPAQEDSP